MNLENNNEEINEEVSGQDGEDENDRYCMIQLLTKNLSVMEAVSDLLKRTKKAN